VTAVMEDSFFEYIRDTYFENPLDGAASAKLFNQAAEIVGEGLFERRVKTGQGNGLQSVASDLVKDYLGARYFDHKSVAQLHPAGFMPAILASLAASITNNNTIVAEVSPVESRYEQFAVKWMLENLGHYDPKKGSGLLLTGGTMANLTALTAARLHLEATSPTFRKRGPDGYQFRPAKLFITSMGHYSLTKAAGVLAPEGLVEIVRVPLTPKGYTMDPVALEKLLAQAEKEKAPVLAVIAVAGETETGLVDDLEAISAITKKYGVFLHVDGAYGVPFRLSQAGSLFKGLERADTITCDPHKYMYTNYAAGAVLFREAKTHALLHNLNVDGAGYMFQDDPDSRRLQEKTVNGFPYLGQKRIEGSMGGHAAAMVYHTIRSLGVKGLAALLDHDITMTKLFAAQFSEGPLVPAHDIQLNTVCLRPNVDNCKLSPAARRKLGKQIEDVSRLLEEEHGIYLSTTLLPCQEPEMRNRGEKEKVFRAVFTHPYTGQNEVIYIADTLKQLWEDTSEGSKSRKRSNS
jgi:glutamate/tyrosine decarboxylase-like PLP-dependent enzyme